MLPLVSPDGRTLLARNAAGEPAVFAVDDLVRGVTGPKVLRGLDGAGVTRVSWAAGTVFVQTPDRYLRCALPTGACAAYQPGREEVAGTARLVVRFPA